MEKQFETYLPNTVKDIRNTKPSVFNGNCNIRKHKVIITEMKEDTQVLIDRLVHIYLNREELGLRHSENMQAMNREARNLGISLSDYD